MATKQIAWNTGGGNISLTYQGQGDGTITVSSDDNPLGTSRSQVVTVETVDGIVSRNLTISQAACPFPVNTTKSYSYTGSYQEVELPAGQYKLQCWGAQGGSNGTNSTYGITAKAGGKGGYSEGIITLSQKTTVRVYVGGQGSASAGGFNGGGSTSGTSQYNASNTLGYSKMGGGGGATDIRLSDGALLSRMIVAGGGAGGAMCYKKVTTSTTTWTTVYSGKGFLDYDYNNGHDYIIYSTSGSDIGGTNPFEVGKEYQISANFTVLRRAFGKSGEAGIDVNAIFTYTSTLADRTYFFVRCNLSDVVSNPVITIKRKDTSSSTSTSTDYQVGGVGGGTQGGGYSTTYVGKQDSAGTNGSFGAGANQASTNYRYCSGAGGGGWYGGGKSQSDSSMTYVKYSGGGSGFVNTAANAQYRPSGYTGPELDSGETRDGATSFPNTAGTGNETGHSGNGYAKITRLA